MRSSHTYGHIILQWSFEVIKAYNPLNTWDPVTNLKHYITTNTVDRPIKVGKKLTYSGRRPFINLHRPLIKWSCGISCKLKTFISPLPQCLKSPNVVMWWLRVNVFHVKSFDTLNKWSCALVVVLGHQMTNKFHISTT